MVANLIKVKVYPKELKAIPDVLPYKNLIQGEPVELELTKKEILRCMNFGDVFDMTSGDEVLIDEIAFNAIVEYVEAAADEEQVEPTNVTPVAPAVEPVMVPETPVETEE